MFLTLAQWTSVKVFESEQNINKRIVSVMNCEICRMCLGLISGDDTACARVSVEENFLDDVIFPMPHFTKTF